VRIVEPSVPEPSARATPSYRVAGKYVRVVVVIAFCLGLACYIVFSRRWPLIWDMQVLHYVSFLIDRGWAPYRQIGDMNMPGAYLLEGWALHSFGSSDFGWRLYDFTLGGAIILAMISIAKPYDWMAGFVAGATFTMVHAAEGPRNAGQRDQVMAVLLIIGYAFCFLAVRRHKASPMFLFGLCVAMAASIKPTIALVGPILLIMAVRELRRQRVASRAYVGWSFTGFFAAIAIVVHFLVVQRATRAFVFDLTQVLPHYVTIDKSPWLHLLRITLQPPLVLYVGAAIVIGFMLDNVWNWEMRALLVGAVFGLVSFYSQRKGFFQHRYTFTAFILLWSSILIFSALGARGFPRVIGYAALICALLYIPRNVRWIRSWPNKDDFSAYLERDFVRMGVDHLQHQVQCLDIVDGCLNALYHLRIVQSTGATGDLLYFLPGNAPLVERARSNYWAELKRNPPTVFVLSNWQFGEARNFYKVNAWPAFATYLNKNYEMYSQYEFHEGSPPTSHPGSNPNYPAYRIYVRRKYQPNVSLIGSRDTECDQQRLRPTSLSGTTNPSSCTR
jgi:hypothetical protein